MSKWWFDYGDIDNSFEFFFQESEPTETYGIVYGPYNTLAEAKSELLLRYRSAVDEIRGCIADVKRVRASEIAGRK